MTLIHLRQQLRAQASAERAAGARRFFKTGPGEYGEGDLFLGLTVPQVRAMLPQTDALTEKDVLTLLRSAWHEERLLALLILVRRFDKARKDEAMRARVVKLYLANTAWINNWDLVDTSAPLILGVWLLTHERAVLSKLAKSKSLWEHRIAVLATLAFIRAGEFEHTLRLCEQFLTHEHDLMHKACGWMLREAGKRDVAVLRAFLDQHAVQMPRTMLRYAIEKLPEAERQHYLGR
ncbi:MAG: DNA alkylation repair protein [Prosthecobacter sp.]|uniref:DNA alkylation repair protein n=1 Tax=Prosthecobacter sp. TaxID=1965333 RepID=UPI0038FF510B